MSIDLNDYDKRHAAYIEALTKKLESIYRSIIRQAVKHGLSVNFDATRGDIFDFDKFPKLKKRMEELMADMQARILAEVVNGITSGWNLSGEKNDYLVEQVLKSSGLTEEQITEYRTTRNTEARDAFLRRKVGGLGLSDRVWNLTEQFKTELELALDVGIGEGRSAQQISRDVRQYLNQPDKLFRRVRDKHGNLKLSKAAAAYHPGQGVYRSSYKNALRMARTEVNMAYRSADHERWSEEWFVIGIEVRLSNNHTCNGKPLVDICDYLKGQYPKTFKFTGWHPQCRCYAIPITYGKDEVIEYIKARREGKDVSGWKFKGEVKEPNDGFKKWVDENAGRVARMRSTPYFIRDNWGGRLKDYARYKGDEDYKDVRFDYVSGGYKATHVGHNLDKRKGWYEEAVRDTGYKNGHAVVLEDEPQNIYKKKSCEGLWNGVKFEVAGAESGTPNNIRNALKHCADKPECEVAVVFFPEDSVVSMESIRVGISKYTGLSQTSQYREFKKIYFITGGKIIHSQ